MGNDVECGALEDGAVLGKVGVVRLAPQGIVELLPCLITGIHYKNLNLTRDVKGEASLL